MFKYLFLILLLPAFSVLAQPTIQWTFDTYDAAYGQACAGDLDGDGKLEVVFGCYRNDSSIYALNAEDGSLLWRFNAAGVAEGCNDVAPLIYDVDNDGQMEVIVPSSCNPKTFCLDGATGAVKWVCNTRGSDSPPTIADIDGDGLPDILHGQFWGYVICINAQTGVKKWEIEVDTNSWVQTAPTIVDLDGDGNLDFVVATWNAVDKSQNKVYAYRGYDQQLLWTHPLNDVVYHGTAVGDLDGDGKPELIIGSYNDTLYCLNGENGTVQWKYSAGEYFAASGPAVIADLDGDGECEVIYSAWYKMMVLDKNGTLKWEYNMPNYGLSFRGPVVADVTNDSYKDIIFGTSKGNLIGISGNGGTPLFDVNLRTQYGDSLFEIDHAPLIADFNQDGALDVFVAGGYGVYPFANNFGRAYMLSIGPGHGPDWLMFQHDVWRQSNTCTEPAGIAAQTTKGSFQFEVVPNPAVSHVMLSITAPAAGPATLEIRNYLGQKIAEQTYRLTPGRNQLPWTSTAPLPKGMYFFVLRHSNARRVQRVVWQ